MAADLHLPHQLSSAYKTLTAQCHCKSVHFTVGVPTSALPLPVHLCHCSICRYTHGTLCSFHAPLPKGVEPDFVAPSSIESSLTGYIHSPQAASERFFCTTCGCHIGDRDLTPDPDTGKPEWRVATSIFTATDDDTFQIRSHCFTTPSTEPNLATWLPSLAGGRALHTWNPQPGDPQFPLASDRPPVPVINPDDRSKNLLTAQCHCASVRFTIAPPADREAAHPLLSRYLRASAPRPRRQTAAAPTTTTTPLRAPTGPTTLKRVACLCLCRDCRLTSGAHAVGWTFVPASAIRPALSAEPGLELEGVGGAAMRVYRSSEGVRRGFCGRCGATVFYVADAEERVSREDGERVVDVAVGVLRDWEGRVGVERFEIPQEVSEESV
ncbi:hypothetical protein NEMBOFW57_007797 [Staphylotrichum longicolle]|uniref:CENP-V/GFA domain-containing protein n=1 Tax=Staphylotrichum longicolle TaxID=669026 RepID=A0AAD4EV45_9PEZI|nr:hypothetical protein NEMBOFW57_007797 [Staphylotrichum longicolle]